MFKIGEKVRVKTLKEMLDTNILKKYNQYSYINEETSFVLLSEFNYFNIDTTIQDIDNKDQNIPYFLSCGIWMPECMLESLEAIKPQDKVVNEDVDEDVEAVNVEAAKPEVYINKFTGKPFGTLMVKLIKLDKKVAEFSSTRFSRLRRHELEYIASLLMKHGAEVIDVDDFNVKELSTYCYNQTLSLNA